MVRERPSNGEQIPPGGAPWGSPDAEVGRLLAFTAKLMRGWFEDQLATAGGSLTTWVVLSAAMNHDPSPSQSELADSLGIGGPTLVRHIDRLEAEGLLIRRRDEIDRRITRIDITDAGRVRHKELAEVSARANAELTALLSERDEKIVRAALQTFTDFVIASSATAAITATHERVAE